MRLPARPAQRALEGALTIDGIARRRAGSQGETLAYTFLADGESAEQHLTYAALDRRARAIAAELQRLAQPGDRVLLLYEPGLEYVAAFYGCLYAGMVAVPAFPPEPLRLNRTLPRLQAILSDARASLVLGTSSGLSWFDALLGNGDARRLATDGLDTSPNDWRPVEASEEDLAYLQYTSGSTGVPRGVMISHRNLLHNVAQIERGQGERTVGVTWLPMYHDFGLVAAVLLPMYSGSRTISMSPLAFLQRPWRWLAAVTRYRGTIIGGPNFAYELCVQKISAEERRQLDLSSLSIALNGAEVVRPETLERFTEAFAPCGFRRQAFVPCYGLAEATLGVTGGASLAGGPVVERFETEGLAQRQAIVALNGRPTRSLVSAGRTLDRTEVLIVDPETHTQRPARQVGEVWVRGPGVARGYWNRPEETETTFRACLCDGSGPYLRTGDLGFLHRGELFITGRLKDLIIVQGRNLYAQDVEHTASRSHALLKPDAAAAFSIDAAGEEHLVVVQELKRAPKDGNIGVVSDAIRQAVLAEHDASVYAIALIRSGTLPRTTSHKVQRQSCRQAFLDGHLEPLFQWRADDSGLLPDGAREQAAPRTPTESRLFELWREVLRLDDFGIHDNFFDLGGQSLLATQLVARIRRQWQIDLPLAALFRSPTIASLSGEIDAAPSRTAEPKIDPTELARHVRHAPLSFAQQRLYFVEELAAESALNHLCVAASVRAPLDGDALWRSLLAVAERHQSLRTTFERTAEGPRQIIHEWQLPTLVEIDLRWSPPDDRQRVADEHVRTESLRPFDLHQGPLWRVIWLQLADDEHRLVLAMHHIISDGWSMGVLLSELWQVYQAQLLDRPPPLEHLPVQYADYAIWQRSSATGEIIHSQLDYWRRRLVHPPDPIDLPTDRPRPAVATYRGATRPIELTEQLTAQLETLARDAAATPFVVLLASLQALLHRYTGQTDLCVGAAAANRSRPEFEPLVGFFVNLLPLRCDLSDDPTFRDLLARAKQTALDAFDHQDVPFERLVEEFAATRDASHSPLVQVALVVQNAPLPSIDGIVFEEVHNGAAKFELTFALSTREGRMTGTLEYNTDLFDAETADRLIANWSTLLASALSDPEQRISQLPVIDPVERQQLLDWSATAPAPEISRCVYELFERWADETPEAVAVTFEGQQLTYRQLNQRANRLARRLREGPGFRVRAEGSGFRVQGSRIVGICVERSLDTVVAILGALKAGAAYLPLDTAWPTERIQGILDDAKPEMVLAQQAIADRLAGFAGRVIFLDDPAEGADDQSAENLPVAAVPDDLAYVIYTSGSTGRPKGVMVTHASLAALLKAMEPACEFKSRDIWTLFHSYAFDFSVWEFWGALAYGGKLVVVPRDVARSADRFYQLLIDEQVTVLNQTPAAFSQLLRADEHAGPRGGLLTLRLVIVAGEMLDVSMLSGWFERHGDEQPRLVNMYGITETTVHATWRPLSRVDASRAPISPIGKPIPGWQVFVLDERMQLAPIGVPGELYVGGPGLAQGYLNRPELTDERFVPHPFCPQPGARLYRSGDRVRWRADGDLEYFCRLDQQVKIRGFRIELGEIEALLAQHPRVREAAVLAREDQPGDKRLVGYVVERLAHQHNGHADLRDWLRERLPDYMVPAALVTLDALPMTTNGKLDRRALPAPDASALTPRTYIAPRNQTETALADVWAELLGVERVGIADNFFELGGHSLLAMQLMARMRERFRAELPLRRLFESPTVEALARAIEGIQATTDDAQTASSAPWATLIERAPRRESTPLSFAQERLFFLEQLDPGNPAYHVPAAVRIEGPLDVAALRASLDQVVERHEILRTRFAVFDGQAVQSIAQHTELPMAIIDLSHLADKAQASEVEQLALQAAREPFDLGTGPLLRVQLLRLGDARHVFLLVLHHLAADGWSLGVLVRELAELYAAHRAGRALRLPVLPVQYADYAAWQRRTWTPDLLDKHLAYWTDALAGIPGLLELPTDRPRPAEASGRGDLWTAVLPRSLLDRLGQLARRHDATLYMTLLAAFQVLLGRLAGQDRFCVGTPVAGRLRRELEGLIGLFVNTLILPADLTRGRWLGQSLGDAPAGEDAETARRGDADKRFTFAELLDRVQEATLAAFAHQELPFEKLVEHLQPDRCSGRTPMFQVMFALQNAPLPSLERSDLTIRPVEVPSGAAKFDLTLSLRETNDGLEANWEYSTDLFDRETIARWSGHFQTLLESIVADPQTPIDRLPLLTAVEQKHLLSDWNQTACEYPHQRCVHELFAEQAARRPEAVALLFGDHSLTYVELNRRANQLAHYLRSLGVGPEVRVGLALDRSIDMIVALVAIAKAGGCYVPLDLTYPAQRLEHMLGDARPAVVITQGRKVAPIPARRDGGEPRSPSATANPVTECRGYHEPARWLGQSLGDAPAEDAETFQIVDLEAISADLARQNSDDPPLSAGPDDLAYIIYTSGSTGTPKGIAVPHRAIVRLVSPMSYCPVDERDVFLHASPISFDASTFEIWGALARGATLAVAPPGTPEMGKLVRRHRVTVLWLTAALFHTMVDEDLESLAGVRRLLAGGDVLSPVHVRRFVERFPDCSLINGYGPTEGTTFSCCHTIGRDETFHASVPIGRSIDNTLAYVLDEQRQPVPVGVPGELYLGGDGLARGYWDRPELTAERFVANPFAPSGRVYRTGDRVRWRADGVLEFLGRLDQQLKIRGFRIEPGEIETVLALHPKVRNAAVIARDEEPTGKRLIAYIVPRDLSNGDTQSGENSAIDPTDLRDWLQRALPDFMVPSAFVTLDALPLTANGKVDRRALTLRSDVLVGWPSRPSRRPGRPSYDGAPSVSKHDRVARTATEITLAAIWCELLGLERVGIDDNFFDLGGHSLLAMRVAARVRERVGIDLPLRRVFEAPTIAELAAALDACPVADGAVAGGAIERANRAQSLPLSFSQERLFFLNQLQPASPLYNIAAAVTIDGDFDAQALRSALDHLVSRHEILRTRFCLGVDGPVQEMISSVTLDVPLTDLSGLGGDAQTAEVERLAQIEARRPFDLSRPPALRVRLLKPNDERHVIVLVVHHVVADGWSLDVLVRELAACYQARRAGHAAALPVLPIQYADYAVWQRQSLKGETLHDDLQFWQEALREAPPVLELPTDRPRPAAATGRGGEVVVELPAALVDDLRRLARDHDATLYMTLLAAFEVLLGRLSGQERFCVGTPVAGRERPELEGLIGLFVNTLVLPVNLVAHLPPESPNSARRTNPKRKRGEFNDGPRLRFGLVRAGAQYGLGNASAPSDADKGARGNAEKGLTFQELLRRVKETALAAFAHQQLPFEQLVDHLQPDRQLGQSPLFQAMFALHNSTLPELKFPDASLRLLHVTTGTSAFDLTLSLRDTGGTLEALWQYSSDLFDRGTIVRWAGHFQTLLQSIVERPESTIDQLDLLTTEEQRQIVEDCNDTARSFPNACVHELFAEQAARCPDAVALVLGQQTMTYGELNARANQLAHYLISRGVGPESRVALALERSFDMVAAVLGVLKAGGAFVPLDLNYPAERLRFMLSDAQPSVVLIGGNGSSARWLGQSLGDAPVSVAPALRDGDLRSPGATADPVTECRDYQVIDLGAVSADLAAQSSENPPPRAMPHNLAYVIYTSGSTGTPKGVAVEHRGWSNLAMAQRELFQTTADDRVLQFASLSFDASVWEISLALASGAALVLVSPEELLPGEPLVELCRRQRVTIATLPPSILAALPEAELSELRLIISAGEACRAELVRRWGRGRQFVNAYGPTETTVCATLADCVSDERRPPIGRPLPNVRVYVLDRERRPTPVGVPGELYVGGAGLARGYLNQPGLTAERFIPDAFAQDCRLSLRESTCFRGAKADYGRLYRTGDLARWRPDGQLEFVGRVDQQVKIRGFRIEPGEIEAALAQHPRVREAAVVVREDRIGQPRLAAYVVSDNGHLTAAELRGYLLSKLPAYMVPGSLMLLDRLPVSANGKLDARALPDPAIVGSNHANTHREPTNETEQALVEIWREVLGHEQVGVDDNFFELGGDSIQTLMVVSRARQRGVFITPRQVFEDPTVARLAAVATSAPAIEAEQGLVTGEVPLMPIQRWFLDLQSVGWALPTQKSKGQIPLDDAVVVGNAHPTIQSSLRTFSQEVLLEVAESIDASLLEQALAQLVLHHDALRLRFRPDGNGWCQFNAGIEALPTAFVVEHADQRGLARTEQEADTRRLLARLRGRFDLETGPLVAAATVATDRADRLLLTIHHLVVDTVSWHILLEDLLTAYRQLAAGQSPRLPPKTTSLEQWATRLAKYARSHELAGRQTYWRDVLAPPAARLPRDLGDGKNDHRSTAALEQSLTVRETAALADEVSLLYRMPVQDIVLSALAHALRAVVGDDVVIDVEGHGRETERFDDIDLSRTVGWFTSLYPVRLGLGGATAPGESLVRAKESLRQARERGFEYGVLRYLGARDLGVPESPAEVCFNYLGQHLSSRRDIRESLSLLKLPAAPSPDEEAGAAPRPYLIEVAAKMEHGQLALRWTYSRNVFRDATIRQLSEQLLASLRELIVGQPPAAAGRATPADFPLARLDEDDLARLMGDGRDVVDVYPLSPLQLGMLYHSLAEQPLLAVQAASDSGGGGVYVEQLICRLIGPLDVAVFRRAWQTLLDRHASLRTAYAWHGLREPLAIVQRQVEIPWSEHDWSQLDESEQTARLELFLQEDRRRGFDLSTAPLLRLAIVRLADDAWRLVWTHHHLLLDGWSLPLVVKELMVAYESTRRGEELSLPSPRPYRDFIHWLTRQNPSQSEAYWRSLLEGFTAPTPLVFEAAGEVGDFDSRTVGNGLRAVPPALAGATLTRSASEADPLTASLALRVNVGDAPSEPEHDRRLAHLFAEAHFAVSAATTKAAGAFVRRHRLTLNTLLQGAWAIVLAKHAGHDDVVYGTTLAGRPATLAGAEAMIGLFINTLPLRVRLEGESSVVDWLRALQAQLADTRLHEQTPLANIRSWSELAPGVPLFESLFVFENYPLDALNVGFRSAKARSAAELEAAVAGLQVRDLESRSQTNFPLSVVISPGEQIALRLNYDTRRFARPAIERLAAELEEVVVALVANPECQLCDLDNLCRERPPWRSAEGHGDVASRAVEPHAARSLQSTGGARRSLPDKVASRSTHLEPRTELERMLAQIWREVLGRNHVGIDDNFFELGGDSIQAVRVMSLAAAQGRPFPPQLIFERPTIAALAAAIDGTAQLADESNAASCIVPIRTAGTKAPLVCIHPVGGMVFPYYLLAHHLDADQPVYAMQSRGLAGGEPHGQIEAMAADYLAQLRAIVSLDKIQLVGWSFGGIVAYEMARQLLASGESPPRLVLIDSGIDSGSLESSPDAGLAALFGLYDSADRRSMADVESLDPTEKLRYFTEQIVSAGLAPAQLTEAEAQRLLTVFEANARAGLAYCPQPAALKAMLFRADEHVERNDRDPTLGWGALMNGGLKIESVPGAHLSLVREPQVRTLAERLIKVIR